MGARLASAVKGKREGGSTSGINFRADPVAGSVSGTGLGHAHGGRRPGPTA